MHEHVLLCVDDEISVLHALKRGLRKEAYRIVTAAGGREGLAQLEAHPVQVVLTDHRMPGMEGTTFLQQVKQRYPDTIRVMLSGYADVHTILESINKGEIYRFVPKPWNDEELKLILRQCFEQHHLLRQHHEMVVRIREKNEALQHLNETLRDTVAERTHSLAFVREVVERLPFAVLGISSEGLATLANDAARRLLTPTRFCPGADVGTFLPPAVVKAVTHHLHTARNASDNVRFSLNGQPVEARIIGLNDRHDARGCILLIGS